MRRIASVNGVPQGGPAMDPPGVWGTDENEDRRPYRRCSTTGCRGESNAAESLCPECYNALGRQRDAERAERARG